MKTILVMILYVFSAVLYADNTNEYYNQYTSPKPTTNCYTVCSTIGNIQTCDTNCN